MTMVRMATLKTASEDSPSDVSGVDLVGIRILSVFPARCSRCSRYRCRAAEVLQFGDDLHGPLFRRAGHRAAGEEGPEELDDAGPLLQPGGDGGGHLVDGLQGLDVEQGGDRPPMPVSATIPRSLRSRSTIIRFSALSFGSSRSLLLRRLVVLAPSPPRCGSLHGADGECPVVEGGKRAPATRRGS